MIHEDITISGSFLVSGSFTLPRVASSSLADATTGSMFYDTSQNVVKIYTGEGLTGYVAVGDQVDALYYPSASFIDIALTGSQSTGNNVASMSISDTDNQTPFSASLSGTNASSFTFEYTNADSSSGFIEAAGTLTSGTYNYTVTVFDSDLNSSSVARTTVIATPPSYTAEFLVVAGGGGAYAWAGGGAGGLRTSYGSTSGGGCSAESDITINPGTVYTATIGAGGAADGYVGADSSLAGSGLTTITSIGGGGGGHTTSGPRTPNGGSGGGHSNNWTDGTNSGGSGTSCQGYNGGGGTAIWGQDAGGGGGGAAAAGTDRGSGTAGNGGNGLAVSITGTSITYAGGGAGANSSGPTFGTSGTGYDQPGGGGPVISDGSGGRDSTAGQDGVVILRVPTANYTGTTTGSPTVTTDGSHTVIKFTSTGTYTG